MSAIGMLAAVALVAAAPSPAPTPGGWTLEIRAHVLDKTEDDLNQYFFVDRVGPIRAALEAKRASLLQISDPLKFAGAVSSTMYGVAHDKHLGLMYSLEALPNYVKLSPAERAAEQAADTYGNYGFDGAIRLNGNIGYLRFRYFSDLAAKPAIDEAMAFLSRTDALIIDLRGNGGGNPKSLDYLMGYFFARPTQLTSIVWREHGKISVTKQFSARAVAGSRYLNKPLFVLIDKDTFSCAEQFAYDIKSLHRAPLIGQRTGGGANPGRVMNITDHFAIFMPMGQAKNPYTGTNWEGIGVSPDIETPSNKALVDAYTRALKAAKSSIPVAAAHRAEFLKNPTKAIRDSLPAFQFP